MPPLTASDGTWTGTPPIALALRWQRCTSAVACEDVPGATGTMYAPTDADLLLSLRVVVTAANPGGAVEAASALAGPVMAAAGPGPPSGQGPGPGDGGGTGPGGPDTGGAGGPSTEPPASLTAEDAIVALKGTIDRLGPVNMMAIEQFDELESRHEFLTTQRKDLVDSIAATADAIRRIDETSQARSRSAEEGLRSAASCATPMRTEAPSRTARISRRPGPPRPSNASTAS